MSNLTTTRGFAPTTIAEAMQFSEMLAKSAMVPRAYQGKPEDILVAVQWGYEIGLAPLQSLQNISVINGKPSVYGDALMALVQASPVCEGIEEYFEDEGTPNPAAVCVARRKGRTPVTAKFSVEDAKRSGLWGKQGPWQAYPKRMLQMRARGFALRDAFPDVLKGLITAEEAQDYSAEPEQAAKPVAPKNPLDALAAPDPVIEDDGGQQQRQDEEQQQAEEERPRTTEEIKKQFEDAGVEVVEVQSMSGFLLKVPGKGEPVSVHPDLAEWSTAYEALADKTFRAGKVPPPDRITKLKALRDANELVLKRMDGVATVKHSAAFSKRISALGAASSN